MGHPITLSTYIQFTETHRGTGQWQLIDLPTNVLVTIMLFLSVTDLLHLQVVGMQRLRRLALHNYFWSKISFADGLPLPQLDPVSGKEIVTGIYVGSWIDSTSPTTGNSRTLNRLWITDTSKRLFAGYTH
jgi:hypothetical protein